MDWGELGYVTGIGSYGGTNQYKDRVFLGDDGNNVNPVGGYYYTSMMEHVPGSVQGVQNTRNSDNGVVAILAPASNSGLGGANSLKVDQWNVDNIRIDGSAISSTDTDGDINVDPNGTGRLVVAGVVTAPTYHGDQVIGTPTGGSFRAGAYEPDVNEFTKDSIDELNYILGKLVPTQPDGIGGEALTLTGTAGVARLCQGFTPVNNTGGSLNPTAGTLYTRNIDSTITTNYLTEYGPGDSGTVTGFVNSTSVGSRTMNVSFGLYAVTSDNGTYGALQIANDKDAAESTRNVGIASLFYEVYDARLINAASPDGFNKAYITHGSDATNNVFWYEDPSTVTAPVISFGSVTPPAGPTLNYSSGVPHYTEASANNFTYDVTVTNASGDMYTQNKLLNSDGQTAGFQNPGHKDYDDFTGGTLPPAKTLV